MPSYSVKTNSPRSFTQQIFLKSGGSAILRMKGDSGVIESEKSIPEKDLNFVLTIYNLFLNDVPIVKDVFVEEIITTTKKPVKKSTKVSTTLPEVQFTEDL